jgi:hypothetical protein
MVENPHPWGITYTLFELIKNAKYQFKSKPYFTQKPPDKIL